MQGPKLGRLHGFSYQLVHYVCVMTSYNNAEVIECDLNVFCDVRCFLAHIRALGPEPLIQAYYHAAMYSDPLIPQFFIPSYYLPEVNRSKDDSVLSVVAIISL